MNEYWLVLQPYTFIFNTTKEVLFYNSETGHSIREPLNYNLKRVVDELLMPSNAYCASLTEEELSDSQMLFIVTQLRTSFSGEIIKKKSTSNKPFMFRPVARLFNDIDFIVKIGYEKAGESIAQLLGEININLNTNCELNCLHCSEFYKQTPYCNRQEIPNFSVDFEKLHSILNVFDLMGVMKVTFSVSKLITNTPELNLLTDFGKSRFQKHIQFHSLNCPDRKTLDLLTSAGCTLEILFHFPIKYEDINNVINVAKEYMATIKVLVTDEYEYQETLRLFSNIEDDKIIIQPFYNTKNLEFFRNFIFVDSADLETSLSKNLVYGHKKLNSNDFGRLVIQPDGNIYANINKPPLGTIDDDIRKHVYNEMTKGTSWRRIRNMQPCSDCVYQWLCPSPSNYELAIGKPNLCHVKP